MFSREARKRWAENRALVSWLRKTNRDLVIGDYWTVYYLNFDTVRSVTAVPLEVEFDWLRYGQQLGGRQRHAALLDHSAFHLQHWAKRLGLAGHMEQIGSNFVGFVVDDPLDASAIERVRIAAKEPFLDH